MPDLVPWLVVVHVLAAIVGFGPTFAFPLVGALGGREPQHANFAARANDLVSHRLTWPLALSMAVTGVLIIWAAEIDLLKTRWLISAIVLYVAAMGYSFFVQQPASAEVVRLGSTPPPPGAPPSGPSPELRAAIGKVQRGGMLLGVLVVVLVALMVVKPEF